MYKVSQLSLLAVAAVVVVLDFVGFGDLWLLWHCGQKLYWTCLAYNIGLVL